MFFLNEYIAVGLVCLLFFGASLLRAARLHLCLGALRPNFLRTCVSHFCAYALLIHFEVFIYEAIVLAVISFRAWYKLFPSLITILIMKIFDISLLLLLSLCIASVAGWWGFTFILIILLMTTILTANTIVPIIRRCERNIIEFSGKMPFDVKMLNFFYFLRQGLAKLPWEKKGTITMVAMLTIGIWAMEVMAFYVFSASMNAAIQDVLARASMFAVDVEAVRQDSFSFYLLKMTSYTAAAGALACFAAREVNRIAHRRAT